MSSKYDGYSENNDELGNLTEEFQLKLTNCVSPKDHL